MLAAIASRHWPPRPLLLLATASLACLPAVAFDDHVFVITSDSAQGDCDALDVDPPWTATVDLEQVGSDATVRYFFGMH